MAVIFEHCFVFPGDHWLDVGLACVGLAAGRATALLAITK